MNEQQVERLAQIANQGRFLLGHITGIEEALQGINERGWLSTLRVESSTQNIGQNVCVPKDEAVAILNRMLADARSKLDELKVDA